MLLIFTPTFSSAYVRMGGVLDDIATQGERISALEIENGQLQEQVNELKERTCLKSSTEERLSNLELQVNFLRDRVMSVLTVILNLLIQKKI